MGERIKLHYIRKCMYLPINGTMQQDSSHEKDLGYQYKYFYLSMGASISSTPSPTGHITKEMPEFCNKFNIAWCSVPISKL